MSTNFLKNNADMIEATGRCIEMRQFLPALVLMYTHIDALAWAGSEKQKQSVRRNYEEWVTRWLLPEFSAEASGITATDLFAARCGILHSLTSKSELSSTGSAKQIAYAWGSAQTSVLDAAIATTAFSRKLITLHYETLFNGMKEAIAKFIQAAETDPSLMARLEEAADQHYVNIPPISSDRYPFN